MSDDKEKKSPAAKMAVGGAAVLGVPVAVAAIASNIPGTSVEDVVKLATMIGVLPALLIIGFWATVFYVQRKDDESRAREERMVRESQSREDRMAARLDTVEDRYHKETVSLAERCIAITERCTDSLDKNTEAFRDLHTTVLDCHQQQVLLLTKHVQGGSVSLMAPLATHGEVDMVKDAMRNPQKQ